MPRFTLRPIGEIFVRGLFYTLPVILTVVLLLWLAVTLESVLGSAIVSVLGPEFYIPGMGVVAGLLLIFLVGLMIPIGPVRRIGHWTEAYIERIPGINSVYGAFRDLVDFLRTASGGDMGHVVSVTIPNTDWTLLGFLTREHCEDLPEGLRADDKVAVYLPMGYQIGGYTIFMPRDQIRPVDMGVQDALRFAITAAMISPQRQRRLPEQAETVATPPAPRRGPRPSSPSPPTVRPHRRRPRRDGDPVQPSVARTGRKHERKTLGSKRPRPTVNGV
jgi:uncharacterized membrane protein